MMLRCCSCLCQQAVRRTVPSSLPSALYGERAPPAFLQTALLQLRGLSTKHRLVAGTALNELSRPSLPSRNSKRSSIIPSRRSSSSSTIQISQLTDRKYHELSDATMESLTERLEEIQEELGNSDFDVEYSSGVLTLKLPDGKGTYVINKQPPNKQIWLSSPTSGPKRYDWSDEQEAWFYARDGSVMLEMLETELSEKLGIKTDLQ